MTEHAYDAALQPPPASRWLLVSDLDDTLTGDDAALRKLLGVFEAVTDLRVAINSSRPIASIFQTLREFPGRGSEGGPEGWRPDAVIGAMGTEVLIGEEHDATWSERFTNWDRERLDRVLSEMGFTPHSPHLQTDYKVSYTVPTERREEAAEAILATGLAVQVVMSGDNEFDVIPEAAGKAAVIEHLLTRFGMSLDPGLVVAGDSANDLAMFELAKMGIVVGNARVELRDAVEPAQVHFAKAPRAGGVLEGLEAWGVGGPAITGC